MVRDSWTRRVNSIPSEKYAGFWIISFLRIPSTLIPVLFVDRIGSVFFLQKWSFLKSIDWNLIQVTAHWSSSPSCSSFCLSASLWHPYYIDRRFDAGEIVGNLAQAHANFPGSLYGLVRRCSAGERRRTRVRSSGSFGTSTLKIIFFVQFGIPFLCCWTCASIAPARCLVDTVRNRGCFCLFFVFWPFIQAFTKIFVDFAFYPVANVIGAFHLFRSEDIYSCYYRNYGIVTILKALIIFWCSLFPHSSSFLPSGDCAQRRADGACTK